MDSVTLFLAECPPDKRFVVTRETTGDMAEIPEVRQAFEGGVLEVIIAPPQAAHAALDEVDISLGADAVIVDEAGSLDWGALVVESQGGVSVFVVGLGERDAAALLRKAADALDPPGSEHRLPPFGPPPE
jgi:hypothetical protein